MKFIKIKLKNFKPYYEKHGKPQEITLFDETIKKNISLNIGQTGYGKTSISEAILWCLFGDNYPPDWKEFVNALSIKIAKQENENVVNMSVELVLELEGGRYKLIRSGSYDIRNGQKVEKSKLSILHNGVPIPDDSEKFIANHFPTVELMQYFVFDADDILKKFEVNREGTIKEHINNFAGVKRLDDTIFSLKKVMELYDDEIREKESQIHNGIADNINKLKAELLTKEEAINHLKEDIEDSEKEKNELFKGSPSPDITNFSTLVDKRDELEEKINELNRQFVESEIISNIDLLFLDCVADDAIKKLNQKQTTKEEFENSSEVIKSSLGEYYSGVFFDEKEHTHLIKKGAKIWDDDLDDLGKLRLESGEGIKSLAIRTFGDYKTQIDKLKEDFKKNKKDLVGKMKELMNVRYSIKQIGDTTKNRELKEKYERFKAIEKHINEKKKTQKEIKESEEEIEEEIEKLRDKLQMDEKTKKDIEQIGEGKAYAKILLDISKKTKEKFLNDLLLNVNKTASEFLRNTVKDTNRFNSIEIDSNYKFKVKQKNGEPLEESQINKGNLQISMMSFFFGLSDFLGKKIPYVIDDPLLRLDPGHDKRLIEQLSKTTDQLILHVIPGKEYTRDSFNWLKPYINTQNWLDREEYKGLDRLSYAERKDAEKIVDFDINKF